MFIYGKNPIKDLFKINPSQIKKIWIIKKRHQSFSKELEKAGFNLLNFNDFNFKKNNFKGNENFQGILAEIKDPKIYNLPDLINKNNKNEKQKLIILDKVEDPQNFGAILRNSAAFDISGVIYSKNGSAKLNSTVMKSSSGNWINVDLCEVNSISNSINYLKENGYWIVSTSSKSTIELEELKEFDKPIVLIFGNEGKGVRRSIQEKSDFLLNIKINPKVESLNVASSTAIILHYLKN